MFRDLLVHVDGSEAVYDVIFDDDGTGESADVVAMRLSGSKLTVRVHHCKFLLTPRQERVWMIFTKYVGRPKRASDGASGLTFSFTTFSNVRLIEGGPAGPRDSKRGPVR